MIYLTRTHSHQDSLAKIENKNPYISNACKPLIYWDSGKKLKKVKFFRTFFKQAASYLMTFVSLFQFSLFLKKRERRRDAAFLFGQISGNLGIYLINFGQMRHKHCPTPRRKFGFQVI